MNEKIRNVNNINAPIDDVISLISAPWGGIRLQAIVNLGRRIFLSPQTQLPVEDIAKMLNEPQNTDFLFLGYPLSHAIYCLLMDIGIENEATKLYVSKYDSSNDELIRFKAIWEQLTQT